MRLLILNILFTVLMWSCNIDNKVSEKDSRIKGDWYSYIVNQNKDDDFVNYTELFFNNDRVYRFSNTIGLHIPLYYRALNDSLFFYHDKNQKLNRDNYVGSLNYKNKDTLYIVNNNDSLVLFKLSNEKNVIGDYLRGKNMSIKEFDKSEIQEEFLSFFLKRLNKIKN